ncbi:MAG: response regulator transcription factor [Spirochaetales bacterium]|nr:response regulator transcription factor [Spirochaetales bacterium]
MKTRVLVVEDEKKLNKMIADYLSALGYAVTSAFDGTDALAKAGRTAFDIAVLDIMIPGIDGLTLARRIRTSPDLPGGLPHDLPIIMLTARSGEGDKLMGLEIGADDYMTKPFSVRELEARIRAVLRRARPSREGPADGMIRYADLEMDVSRRSVRRGGERLALTPFQFDLLRRFLLSPGRVFSREELLEGSGDRNAEAYERTVDAHVKNLRRVIGAPPKAHSYIATVRGVGYRLLEEDEL